MTSRRKKRTAKPDSYTVQIWENKWYLDKFSQHECCHCGLVHDTEWNVEGGRIYTRWKVNEQATKENRKRLGVRVIKKGDK